MPESINNLAQKLVEAGFADERNMRPEVYLDHLCLNHPEIKFIDRQTWFPLVVDPIIDLTSVARLAEIDDRYEAVGTIHDQLKTPVTPYVALVRDPFYFLKPNPLKVAKKLIGGEVECTLRELMHFVIEYPEVVAKCENRGAWLVAGSSRIIVDDSEEAGYLREAEELPKGKYFPYLEPMFMPGEKFLLNYMETTINKISKTNITHIGPFSVSYRVENTRYYLEHLTKVTRKRQTV